MMCIGKVNLKTVRKSEATCTSANMSYESVGHVSELDTVVN